MYRATARSFSADAPTRMSLVLTQHVQGAPSQAGVKWTHVAMKLASEPTGDVDRIFGDGYDGTPLPVAAPAALTKSMSSTKAPMPRPTACSAGWVAWPSMPRGNIGPGFSRSSASTNPQVMYVARTATNPVGQMRDEQNCTAGIANGSQIDSAGRWGDYASMSVDPSDQCTFYFTSEYYATNSARNFQTRVCSFTNPGLRRSELPAGQRDAGPRGTVRSNDVDRSDLDPCAGVYNGFTGAVTLNASGLALGGTSASYSTNPFNAPGSSVLTLLVARPWPAASIRSRSPAPAEC